MKVAMLLVSLLTLATGVGAAPWCKDTPEKCDEGDKCEPEGVWGNCPNDSDHLGCSLKGFCRIYCDVSPCFDPGYVCVPEGNMLLCEPVPINNCPAGCVSVNARQRRQLLFGSIGAECPEGCVPA